MGLQLPAQQRKYRARLRAAVVAALGGRCVQCGFTDVRALQIDHVAGGGVRERRTIGYYGICQRVLRGSKGYQLLCANCNWIKRAVRGEIGDYLS